jgi:aminopeptidase YwaD
MTKYKFLAQLVFISVFCALSSVTWSQYTPWYYWTLLPSEYMDEIIGEASGETAFKTIMETGGYTKNRRPEEYRNIYYEAAYIYDKLQRYGIPGARLERLPARTDLTWNGIKGELWEISPDRQKLVSYRDNAFQLTRGSNSADVRTELVWVGSGTPGEIAGVDVSGKIAVGHGHVSLIHANARRAGAVGVVALSDSRNYIDPLQIPEGRIGDIPDPESNGRITAGFAFQINIREGQYLRERLLRGEKIEVHAQVETSMEPYEIQNIDAIIPGEDPDATAVIFSAHIFEGLVKQGANDNKSGGAAILEVARVLNSLIGEGRIPRPKRSIRFWWGPEFSGSIPWVDMHFDEIKSAFCNINMDMVGEWLSLHNAHFGLMRTTFGNAHYVNDVLENYYRFVGEGNRERVHNRGQVNKIPHRIVAPFGADEPFHYSIEMHYGSSDHIVFNDFGVRIPGVMMIAWPDLWYHTSGDLVDKADPTQLKRAVVIAAAAAYTIAGAGDEMAVKIAGEIAGNATRRLGHQVNVAMNIINRSNAEELAGNYKKAVWLLEAHIINEKATLRSVYELASSRESISTHIENLVNSLNDMGEAHLKAIKSQMKTKASITGISPVSLVLSPLEEKAFSVIPELTPGSYKMGQGKLNEMISGLPAEVLAEYPVISRLDFTEVARLVDGNRSVLDIKKMLDAQNRHSSDLEDIMNFVFRLGEAGVVNFR